MQQKGPAQEDVDQKLKTTLDWNIVPALKRKCSILFGNSEVQ